MQDGESPAAAVTLRKLSYRAWHRGTREMDLLLGPFADAELARLPDEDLRQFEILLNVPDGDLQNWILLNTAAPQEFETSLLPRIRAFHKKNRA